MTRSRCGNRVSYVIAAINRREDAECRANQREDVLELRSRAARTNVFNFANASSIGLNSDCRPAETQLGARVLDHGADLGLFMHGQRSLRRRIGRRPHR